MQLKPKIRVLVLGATGNLGSMLMEQGLALGYEVTALVRNADRLRSYFRVLPEGLQIVEGDAADPAFVAHALTGMDAMLSAAGKVTDGPGYTELFAGIVDAAERAPDFGKRVWMMAGAAALTYPGTDRFIADLPGAPQLYQRHLSNVRRLEATNLDWSVMCPGPMIVGTTGPVRSDLRVSTDISPLDLSRWRRAPSLVQALALRSKLGELVVRYGDVAHLMMRHLNRDGAFRGRRVGVALPRGETARKEAWNPATHAGTR